MRKFNQLYYANIGFVGSEQAQSHALFHKNKQGSRYPHNCPCASTGREHRTPVANVLVLLRHTGSDNRTPALFYKSDREYHTPDFAQ
jgi:hypothetical protein